MSKQNAKKHSSIIKRHSKSYGLIGLFSILFSMSELYANVPALTLKQAIEQVWIHQQKNNVFAAQQEIRDAQVKQSMLWKNPNISITQTGFDANQDKELEISLSQELDIFGQRRALKKLAAIEVSQQDVNQKIYNAELELAIAYLWTQIALQQQELDLSQAQLVTSKATVDATHLRYQAGSIAKLDYDRALLVYIENQRNHQQLEQALIILKKQLSNNWGQSDTNFSVVLQNNVFWPIPVAVSENLYATNLKLEQQRQQATTQYLKNMNRPNPTVSVGVTRTRTAGIGENENQIMFGVDIPLNIFDRQQYSQKIIRAQQQLLDYQKASFQSQSDAQLSTIDSEISGLKQQYDLMDKQQIPLSEEVYNKTLLGFKVGKYSVTDVQQATMQLQQLRLNKMQILKQAWQKSFEAQSLALGIQPELVMSPQAIMQINQKLWQTTQEINAGVGVE